MRAISLAAFAGMMILAAGPVPAAALPACSPVPIAALAVSPPSSLPVRHHGHWRWRHRHGGWSGSALPYGPAPEIDASETAAGGYPSSVGTQLPPAQAPAQGMPDRGTKATVPRPSIQWVNPDRAAR